MKKKSASILAIILSTLYCISGMAYIQTPQKSQLTQVELVSIKAVDVSTSVTGVRNYSEIVDTNKIYQVNDVIILATTLEVKNTALDEYKHLKSIKDLDIDVIVGSDDIDLSLSNHSSPVILSDMYSGYNDASIASIAIPGYVQASQSQGVLDISGIVTFNKTQNELKFTVRGYETNRTQTVEYQNTAASIRSGKIYLPALRAKDGREKIKVGNQEYVLDYTAPSSLKYTILLTGVTKENNHQKEGDYYARMLLSGADAFIAYDTYYVKNGSVLFDEPVGTEFVDYVKINVEKMTLKDSYSVYRYKIPASGTTDDVDIIYLGADSLNTNKVLAKVNTAKYDNNTPQGGTSIESAGSVKKARALNGSEREVDVPAASIVYTGDKSYYAPYFYQGITGISKDPSQISGEIHIDTIEVVKDSRETTVTQKAATSFTGKLSYNRALSASEILRLIHIEINGNNKSGNPATAVHESYSTKDADATYRLSASGNSVTAVITPINGNEIAAASWNVEIIGDSLSTGSRGMSTKATPSITEKDVKEYLTAFYNKEDLNILEKDTSFEVLDKDGNAINSSEYKLTPISKNGKINGIIFLPNQVTTTQIDPTTGQSTTTTKEPDWASEAFSIKVYHLVPDGGIDSVTPITAEAVLKLNEVVGHNGITAYTISDIDDKPLVTIATESTYFSGDYGYAIALFDNTNSKAERIYRSNDGNLTFANGTGYVANSQTIINSLKYFDLDTSFSTTYKVQDEAFTSKGVKAEYSDNVFGSFRYGVIGIVEDTIEEATEEQEVTELIDEQAEEFEEEPNPLDDSDEFYDVTDEADITETPRTSDASANIVIALLVAATVSAFTLTFVMKKTNN